MKGGGGGTISAGRTCALEVYKVRVQGPQVRGNRPSDRKSKIYDYVGLHGERMPKNGLDRGGLFSQ